MKKENKKRIAVLAMTAGMLMPAAIPAMAEIPVPSEQDTAEVKILNIEEAAKVTAYRIYEPAYNEEGFVKFSNVSGVILADAEKPTAAEVTKIAQSILNGTLQPATVIQMSKDGTSYKANLPAGEYIVLVTDQDSASFVYNPMIISSYYTDSNDASSITPSTVLDAEGSYETFYAKKNKIPLDKTILHADGVSVADDDAPGTQGSEADDLGLGDTGEFRISTRIPAYSDAYKAKGVMYTLTDTQDDGFDAPTNFQIEVGGEAIAENDHTYHINLTGNDFEIVFQSDFILAHAGQNVTVDYRAKLNGNAQQKFTPNKDKVVLSYTNDVYDKSHIDTLEDSVKEFTFPVQIRKVNEEAVPLKGAEFTLKRMDGDGKTGTQEYTIATNEEGIAEFDQLDEGIYTVQETEAPAGYAVNPDIFQIQIAPSYQADGALDKYQVTMVNTSRENQTVGSISVENPDDDILSGNITDSKLQTLPATGGRGTKLAMILAAGMGGFSISVLAYAKKKEKKNEKMETV